jgi:hypothetical protein
LKRIFQLKGSGGLVAQGYFFYREGLLKTIEAEQCLEIS